MLLRIVSLLFSLFVPALLWAQDNDVDISEGSAAIQESGAEVKSSPDQGDTQNPEAATDEEATEETAEEDEKAKAAAEKNFASVSNPDGGEEGGIPGTEGSTLGVAASLGGTSGELSYKVEVAIPDYRGLQPKIDLLYNSHSQSREGPFSVLGPGWSLGGFSSISRVSDRLGSPSYDSGSDIFLLDGMELLKCDSASIKVSGVDATSWNYSSKYIAESTSPSCSAGGDFVTFKDSFFRVSFDQANNTFVVSQKNGVRFVYESLGDLAAAASVNSDEISNARRRLWMLTRIEDLQPTPNVVEFFYAYNDASASEQDAVAPRPARVAYNGYEVSFHYQRHNTPLAHFATGTNYLGKQFHRLEAIEVKDGTTKIRAYDLSYSEPTQHSQSRLLTEVQQYGRDYAFDAADPYAVVGSKPAGPTVFGYSADNYQLVAQTYPNLDVSPYPGHTVTSVTEGFVRRYADIDNGDVFHTQISVVDLDGDNRQELLASQVEYEESANSIFDPITESAYLGSVYTYEKGGYYTFNNASDVQRKDDSVEGNIQYPVFQTKGDSENIRFLIGTNRRTDTTIQNYAIMGRYDQEHRAPHVRSLTNRYQDLDIDEGFIFDGGRIVSSGRMGRESATYGTGQLLGNFDEDPDLELLLEEFVYDIGTERSAVEEGLAVGDIRVKTLTSTGAPECTLGVLAEGATGQFDFFIREFTTTVLNYFSARVVDVNADGIDELVYRARTGGSFYFRGDEISKTLEETECIRYFSPTGMVNEIRDATNIAPTRNKRENKPKITSGLGDVNGDGIVDSVFHDYDGATKNWRLRVVLGRGNGNFIKSGVWADDADFGAQHLKNNDKYSGNFVVVTDLNADGLGDVVVSAGIEKLT